MTEHNENDGHGLGRSSGRSPVLRQQLRLQIDENLKRVYNATMAEEMPDRFKDLLAQLGQVDQKQQAKNE